MIIKGKVALITGASRGIGLSNARLISERGATLALVARSKEKLEDLAKELPGSIAIVADLSNPEETRIAVRRAVEHFGTLDMLVNNAGQGCDAPVEKVDVSRYQHIINLDLISPLVAMQEAIPIMRKAGSGSIVNVSSDTALTHFPFNGPYSSVKRALVGLSLTARVELKRDNVSASVVYPYMTLTDFEANTLKNDLPPR
ncbi:SDR family oxidoreductase [Tardisphaera miroshnichenkoae]